MLRDRRWSYGHRSPASCHPTGMVVVMILVVVVEYHCDRSGDDDCHERCNEQCHRSGVRFYRNVGDKCEAKSKV